MSVDTRDKRMSMLGLCLAARLVLPNPDGGFTTAGDRAQLTGQYAGTLVAPVVVEYLVIGTLTPVNTTPVLALVTTTPVLALVSTTPVLVLTDTTPTLIEVEA
jgi:hypothetical protein